MTSDAERRLNEFGLELEELDLGRPDEPDIEGCAFIREVEGGHEIRLAVRPGSSPETREGVAEWALTRLARFFEHGPEPDGWQKRTVDSGWQLWIRKVYLPVVD